MRDAFFLSGTRKPVSDGSPAGSGRVSACGTGLCSRLTLWLARGRPINSRLSLFLLGRSDCRNVCQFRRFFYRKKDNESSPEWNAHVCIWCGPLYSLVCCAKDNSSTETRVGRLALALRRWPMMRPETPSSVCVLVYGCVCVRIGAILILSNDQTGAHGSRVFRSWHCIRSEWKSNPLSRLLFVFIFRFPFLKPRSLMYRIGQVIRQSFQAVIDSITVKIIISRSLAGTDIVDKTLLMFIWFHNQVLLHSTWPFSFLSMIL